ncbi:potassium transporter TrkA [Tolypothrix bouteillei VB521301]|uniref:Potassium transporter TrkA n=1 Tax=Tolypothrix bouteillei VB521301 TaxID=1479485 RepID=A0A8S9TGC6_9CYAN|nr:potassium transporter TrkA [Tolypothrix bouteillei VB521301]
MLLDRFLVCGLGSLGQHCVVALKLFEVSVIAIDKQLPQEWEISQLPDLLDNLIVGDCRHSSVLEQAQILQCRAALIVTNSELVNAETALAVRKLNPKTRIVVRSSKRNLNELLSEHLKNFTAFEPTQLPAPAFALAALGTETLGLFNLEGQWLRVVKRVISSTDTWCNNRLLYDLNTHNRRLLHYQSDAATTKVFDEWELDARIIPGDTIVYIEATNLNLTYLEQPIRKNWYSPQHILTKIKQLSWVIFKQSITEFWQNSDKNRLKQVGIICGVIVVFLLLLGTILYRLTYPKISLINAFLTSVMLLLGGFNDLFGGFDFTQPVPLWLRLISLGMTISGTVLIGIFYSFLTERLLAARFQLIKRRPPVPQKNHVVVVGLGRIGQRIAEILQEFKQPLVGITFNTNLDASLLPKMPLLNGSLTESLARANLKTAKSVVVVTDDEMLNLEVSLMTYDVNTESNLVVRTTGLGLSNNLAELLPKAQILCVNAVASEVFAGAAFGENITHLFRVDRTTILVTEYQIELDDTLNGLLLSDVTCGYGVVPILYQKEAETPKLMPSEDIRLAVGDRMIVLATSHGLQRVEQGDTRLALKNWQVHIARALTEDAKFEGANVIARISGCSLNVARNLMKNLPGTLPFPLYKHQAQRLVLELGKAQVVGSLRPIK